MHKCVHRWGLAACPDGGQLGWSQCCEGMWRVGWPSPLLLGGGEHPGRGAAGDWGVLIKALIGRLVAAMHVIVTGPSGSLAFTYIDDQTVLEKLHIN